jgi:hypothetical protein
MNHLDAAITDVVVILDGKWTSRISDAEAALKSAGMTIDHTDDANGVVEGSIDAYKAHELEQLDCVDYVRKVFTYYADYPRGDARDQDAYEEV